MSARSKFEQHPIVVEPRPFDVRPAEMNPFVVALRPLANAPDETRIRIRWPGSGAADKHERDRAPDQHTPAGRVFSGTVH